MTDQDDSESPIQTQLAAPPVVVGAEQDEPTVVQDSGFDQLLNSRAAIFGILFLVTGVLGIPLLWMSPRFSGKERLFWAIVVTIYTAILIWITVAIVMWSYRQIFG